DPAVLGDRPVGVVGDLPGMPVGVDEDAAVAPPERLGSLAGDAGARGARLVEDRVDLRRRVEVEGEGDAAPASVVLPDPAVLRKLLPAPEREDHVAGLEEDDIVVRSRSGPPADGFVEATGATQVGDTEGDQVDALLHAAIVPSSPVTAPMAR